MPDNHDPASLHEADARHDRGLGQAPEEHPLGGGSGASWSAPLRAAVDLHSGRPALALLAEIAADMRSAETFVVTAHVGPDGDALGSSVALALGLRALGKKARVVTAEPFSRRYDGLLAEGVVESVAASEISAAALAADRYVVLDTSEPERIGDFHALFYREGARRICLDHHRSHVAGRHQLELIVPAAPATGNLVFALLGELGVAVPADPGPRGAIARALWLAIATDTGWFRFANTGPWALGDAARLAGALGDVSEHFDRVYLDLPLAHAQLIGRVLSATKTAIDERFLWSTLTDERRAGVPRTELDGVIDHLKMVAGASVTALITEIGENSYKISLRARGAADVQRIARRFGGGGHVKAAGCRFTGSLAELEARLIEVVTEELPD